MWLVDLMVQQGTPVLSAMTQQLTDGRLSVKCKHQEKVQGLLTLMVYFTVLVGMMETMF